MLTIGLQYSHLVCLVGGGCYGWTDDCKNDHFDMKMMIFFSKDDDFWLKK